MNLIHDLKVDVKWYKTYQGEEIPEMTDNQDLKNSCIQSHYIINYKKLNVHSIKAL